MSRACTQVGALYPGEVFGELSIIQGTARTASVVTDAHCIFYTIEKQLYAHILTKLAPGATHLIPPATAYMHWRVPLKETEEVIVDRMKATIREHAVRAEDQEKFPNFW